MAIEDFMNNSKCVFIVVLVLFIQGISLNSVASSHNAPSKELLQIIALNNRKGKKAAKNRGILRRMSAATKWMVQSPVNYVFGKKPSLAKKAFYTLLVGLSALSIVYGYYNWSIIEDLWKKLVEKEEGKKDGVDSKDTVVTDNISDQDVPKNQKKRRVKRSAW